MVLSCIVKRWLVTTWSLTLQRSFRIINSHFPGNQKNVVVVQQVQLNVRGGEVWGVVYRVSDEALNCLDIREGYKLSRNKRKNSYERCEVTVLRDGEENYPVKTFTYYANPQKNPPLPNNEYKDLLVKGAKERKLPDWYIKSLKQIKTVD